MDQLCVLIVSSICGRDQILTSFSAFLCACGHRHKTEMSGTQQCHCTKLTLHKKFMDLENIFKAQKKKNQRNQMRL